ncbi:protein translocase subunit SecF, partial [Candidatus Microgenomates bacterium]|nr:protein translocase subunit SecF [Candidatus Microgenomates bacterium]
KFRKLYLSISSIVILIGLFSILRFGYRYSIDFVGGTNLSFQAKPPITKELVAKATRDLQIEVIQSEVKGDRITLRTKAIDEKKQDKLKNNLQRDSGSKVQTLLAETVGPTLGRETIRKTIIASLIAIIGILLYMAYAFKGFTFAISAVVALAHDFLVVLGMYSVVSHFFGAEFDTLFVTALLTTMSFSVHDTIIIFDKIREYKRKIGSGDVEEYANRALTETLIRSVNNSMTIIFMLLALVLLGGTTIKFFVAALLIGTITGVYSSPFVATPVWVWLERRKKK